REPERPLLERAGDACVSLRHHEMGAFSASFDGAPELLFCENETNFARVFGYRGAPFPKDAIDDRIVRGARDATNPACRGTKCAAHYSAELRPGGELVVRGRLSQKGSVAASAPFADFDALFAARKQEADDFYAELQDGIPDEDARRVQ